LSDGVVEVAVSASPPLDVDEPLGVPSSPEAGTPAADAPNNDFSWSPSTHVSDPSEFFAHTSSKWPNFAKKPVMPNQWGQPREEGSEEAAGEAGLIGDGCACARGCGV
jgi:hypothetical protein